MCKCFAGCLDLIYTGISGKVEGLQMMTKVESGSHMGMSLVHCQKVSAMILEPVSTGVPASSYPAVLHTHSTCLLLSLFYGWTQSSWDNAAVKQNCSSMFALIKVVRSANKC